jgi:hypothetical protein
VTPDDIFNFDALLSELSTHDWDSRPCVKIIGQEKSGKSKIVEEYARVLLPKNLVIHLDSRALTAEDQLVSEAVACAGREELPASRDQLRPTSAQITITGSSIVGSTITMRNGFFSWQWWRPRRTAPPPPPPRRSLIPTLVEDLENVERLTWIIIDHFNKNNLLVLNLVRQIAPRLARRRGLRLLLVTTEQSPDEDVLAVTGLGSRTMATYRVEALDAEALEEWADGLGLTLDRSGINVVYALSDGRAGNAYWLLMKLAVEERYRSSQHRESVQ